MKWRFAHNDNKGLAAGAGGILYTPLNDWDTTDSFGLIYGNFLFLYYGITF